MFKRLLAGIVSLGTIQSTVLVKRQAITESSKNDNRSLVSGETADE